MSVYHTLYDFKLLLPLALQLSSKYLYRLWPARVWTISIQMISKWPSSRGSLRRSVNPYISVVSQLTGNQYHDRRSSQSASEPLQSPSLDVTGSYLRSSRDFTPFFFYSRSVIRLSCIAPYCRGLSQYFIFKLQWNFFLYLAVVAPHAVFFVYVFRCVFVIEIRSDYDHTPAE